MIFLIALGFALGVCLAVLDNRWKTGGTYQPGTLADKAIRWIGGRR